MDGARKLKDEDCTNIAIPIINSGAVSPKPRKIASNSAVTIRGRATGNRTRNMVWVLFAPSDIEESRKNCGTFSKACFVIIDTNGSSKSDRVNPPTSGDERGNPKNVIKKLKPSRP